MIIELEYGSAVKFISFRKAYWVISV